MKEIRKIKSSTAFSLDNDYKVADLREGISELQENGIKTVHVLHDLALNKWVISQRAMPSRRFKEVGHCPLDYKQIKALCNRHSLTYICKTTAYKDYKEYGADIIEKGFVTETDNPYYKKASPMRIYDRDMIEYYAHI